MKSLPNISQSSHVINDNNQKIFCSYKPVITKIERDEVELSEDEIVAKINKMFHSPQFIYKIDADIVMKDDSTLNRSVIGYSNKRLITMEDEIIPLSQIKDIIY